MRSVRGVFAAVVLILSAVAPAAAQPPAPPLPPSLPAPPDPADLLPGVQEWIDAILPPAPVAPLPPDAPPEAMPPSDVPEFGPDLAALRAAVLPSPVGDAFFDRWPAELADAEPGQVVEVRDVGATAGALVLMPFRQALQLKFRTTDASGRPSFATATLVVPTGEWTGPGQRPVVVNNLPINALGRKCTIGYSMAHGLSGDLSVTDYVPPTLQVGLLRGYAVLLPDHEGPWMSYAEPVVAGRAILDAIRAVRALLPEEFGASPYGMTGYSGGAIATNGAVKQMGDYAPELAEVVVGATLGGVPADYAILARSMNANLASGVFMGAVLGIARERVEILGRMNHLAQWVSTSPLKDSCASTFGLPGVLMLPIDVGANFPDPLHSDFAAEIYRETRMADRRSPVPLYLYNGEQEWWIPAEGARELFREQCALGVAVVYRSVPGEHVIAGGLGYPEAMVWLDDRLRGLPAPNEC
ncbi:lipase family protein [Nocardia takedensis]|uniref:lipase family protein n=1 Tax=Nocardia takedensis TaxID=259390 RepID=UPI000594DB46|nr:lipase family protein [Nocardia takedensis]